MRILYIACCLALVVMLSQARHIPLDMRRYVGTGLFLGKMNGLSPNNTYSDSEATTPNVNDVASETTTMETSSDVTPTIVLAATSPFDNTESSDATTIGSPIVNDFKETIVPTLTPESGSVNANAVDNKIIGESSADLDGQTKASARVGVDYEGTTVFSVDLDGNKSFRTTEGEMRGDVSVGLDGSTTVGVLEGDLAIDTSRLTTETSFDNIKNVKIIGETPTGGPRTTIDVVEGELKATTSSSIDEIGSFDLAEGISEGDVSIGLGRTTVAMVGDGLEAMGTSSVVTDNAPDDIVNDEIKGGAFNDQRGTTMSTAGVQGELTASSPNADTESFDIAMGRIKGGGSTGLDGTTTTALVGDGLEAISSSSVTTGNTPDDIVNDEIKGGDFIDARGKTIASTGVEGEFKASSSPAGDETVPESTGVNTDTEVLSDVNVGSQVSSGSAVVGNVKQSSDGNLDSNMLSTNSVKAKADEEFISETSALNVYKLKPINQAAVKATKGKEAVLIYELATAKYKK